MDNWVEIEGYPDFVVRPDGRVVNVRFGRPRVLVQSFNQAGHPSVALVDEDGGTQRRSVAQIVANAFLEPKPYPHWNSLIHLDGDKANCHADNLMWRPRAYAINYHQQFSTDYVHESWHRYPIYVIDTGEFFENGIDCSMKYGVLLMDLVKGAGDNERVWILESKVYWKPLS